MQCAGRTLALADKRRERGLIGLNIRDDAALDFYGVFEGIDTRLPARPREQTPCRRIAQPDGYVPLTLESAELDELYDVRIAAGCDELKARAALADEAWAMKGRIADAGNASRSAEVRGKRDTAAAGVGEARGPAFDVGGQTMTAEGMEREKNEGRGVRRSGNEAEREADDTAAPAATTNKQEKDDPWKQARRNPGEEWQPESWGGAPAPALTTLPTVISARDTRPATGATIFV